MTRPDDCPNRVCALCGTQLSRADRRREIEVELRRDPRTGRTSWGLACSTCRPRPDPPPEAWDALLDLFNSDD
jgi:hypothetical protein